MSKPKDISLQQREKGLIGLIQDAKELKFDRKLLRKYETQLKEVQAELQEIQEKRRNAYKIKREEKANGNQSDSN